MLSPFETNTAHGARLQGLLATRPSTALWIFSSSCKLSCRPVCEAVTVWGNARFKVANQIRAGRSLHMKMFRSQNVATRAPGMEPASVSQPGQPCGSGVILQSHALEEKMRLPSTAAQATCSYFDFGFWKLQLCIKCCALAVALLDGDHHGQSIGCRTTNLLPQILGCSKPLRHNKPPSNTKRVRNDG